MLGSRGGSDSYRQDWTSYLPIFGVEAGEETFQVLGVPVFLSDQRGCVRVVDHVIAEGVFFFKDVANQAAQEDAVGSCTQWSLGVGHGRGAREPGIDMQDLRPLELGLYDEPESE